MQIITLNHRHITVTLTGDGGGSIESDLKEACPFCSSNDCYFNCDYSQADWEDDDDESEIAEDEDEVDARRHWNQFIDGIEALVLAHAVAGVDVTSPAYEQGLEAALEAAGNNIG